jgi:hypothetical protein
MYKYKPLRKNLPEIRLVTIEKAELPHAPLRLQLDHADLSSKPHYFALSYTWGSPGPNFPAEWSDGSTRCIKIDDQDFHVHLNLFSALEMLRWKFNLEAKFWIDAICIDQSSDEERNHQVPLMKTIYSTALSTLAWLGPFEEHTKAAFQKLERLESERKSETEGLNLKYRSDESLQKLANILEVEFGTEEAVQEWKTVISFFERYYWRRAWIIQEVAAARGTMLICGDFMVNWLKVSRARRTIAEWHEATVAKFFENPGYKQILAQLDEVRYATDHIINLCAFTEEDSQADLSRIRLLDALVLIRSSQSSDPRDKIFAALGLSNNLEKVEPDYFQNTEVVFRNFAMNFIRSRSSLHILGYCSYSPTPAHSTWAPDWSNVEAKSQPISGKGFTGFVYAPDDSPAFYSAGGDTLLQVEFKDDNKILVLQGAFFDRIVFVGSINEVDMIDFAKGRGLNGWLYEWASHLKDAEGLFAIIDRAGWEFGETASMEQFETPIYRLSGENVQSAFRCTMCADTIVDGDTGLRLRLTDKHAEAVLSGEKKLLSGLQGNAVAKGRVFAVSRNGLFCLAPAETMPGDSIAFVSGGEVPLLLRPHEDKFHLVGECYVHCLMDGYGMEYCINEDGLQEIEII